MRKVKWQTIAVMRTAATGLPSVKRVTWTKTGSVMPAVRVSWEDLLTAASVTTPWQPVPMWQRCG